MRPAHPIARGAYALVGASALVLLATPAHAQDGSEPPPPEDYGGEPEGAPNTPPGYGEQPPPRQDGPPPTPPPPRGSGGRYPRVGEPEPEHGQPVQEEAGEPAGHHEHDGFYLRLSIGPGYTRAAGDDDALTLNGGGVLLSFAIGGVVGDNFVIGGDVFGTVSVARADGETALFSGSGLGVTLIRYVMPANVYFSVSAGIGVATLESGTRIEQTDVGFGTNVRVGKEWWVGSDWAVGVGGQLMYFLLKDDFSSPRRSFRLNVYSVGATFNVAFN